MLPRVFGMSCGAYALGAAFFLPGCGGEPVGDAAYSQKFEKPAEVAKAPKAKIKTLSREEERELDRQNPLTRKSKKG